MDPITIGAVAGLVLGAASGATGYLSSVHEKEQALKRQMEILEKQRETSLANINLEYDIAKREANQNADESDRQSTLQEGFLSRGANNQFESLIASQESEGLAFNSQLASMDAEEGNALSSIASSGTRNSSMQQAVDLQAGSNAMQLQAQENLQRSQDNYNLNNVLNSLAEGTENIQRQRTNASALRLAYDDGTLYGNGQGSQSKLLASRLFSTKQNYNLQINELNSQRDHMLRKSNIFLGTLSSMFGGGASGLDTGYKVGTTAQNSFKWKTT